MNLNYLNKYLPHVDIDKLNEINEQKQKWRTQKNATRYISVEEDIISLKLVNKSSSYEEYISLQTDADTNSKQKVLEIAKNLVPWRKGPFEIDSLKIDAEWKSNQKWDRIKDKVGNLKDQVVLDIGCNNGYYMFQMLKDSPELVLGIDPVFQNKLQFDLIHKHSNDERIKFELFGIEELPHFRSMFDTIFSMGIIYHHRHPLEQLMDMREALKSEGTLIIETIGIPGEESICLFPEDRYSKMKNVWFLPTLSCFKNWLQRTGFINIEVISSSITSIEEQCLTSWCPDTYQSLEDFLDPNDKTKTIEGYPAPMRFCLKAQKKPSPIKKFDQYEPPEN